MYVFSTTSSKPFEETISNVTEALQEQGFGVLTEINVSAVLKKKLGIDKRPYIILVPVTRFLRIRQSRQSLTSAFFFPVMLLLEKRKTGALQSLLWIHQLFWL